MDFATKGISWAETIFHKCEDIYRDGITVKVCELSVSTHNLPWNNFLFMGVDFFLT